MATNRRKVPKAKHLHQGADGNSAVDAVLMGLGDLLAEIAVKASAVAEEEQASNNRIRKEESSHDEKSR